MNYLSNKCNTVTRVTPKNIGSYKKLINFENYEIDSRVRKRPKSGVTVLQSLQS